MKKRYYNPFPEYVKQIAITAPAGPVKKTQIEKACRLLKLLGIKTKVMPNVFRSGNEKYLSASIKSRVSDLHKCWEDEKTDLVLCARGGAGAAQLLPEIDWKLIKSRPLPLLGCSDISALHMAMIRHKAGIPVSSHMAIRMEEIISDRYSSQFLENALRPSGEMIKLKMPRGKKIGTIKAGTAKAPAIFANLTVLMSLAGTEYFPELNNKILVTEDINEPVYKLDRLFTQLKLCGGLKKLSGLILGGFKDCGSTTQQKILFTKIAVDVNGPVLYGFPYSHGFPFAAMRIGSEMETGKDSSILIEGGKQRSLS